MKENKKSSDSEKFKNAQGVVRSAYKELTSTLENLQILDIARARMDVIILDRDKKTLLAARGCGQDVKFEMNLGEEYNERIVFMASIFKIIYAVYALSHFHLHEVIQENIEFPLSHKGEFLSNLAKRVAVSKGLIDKEFSSIAEIPEVKTFEIWMKDRRIWDEFSDLVAREIGRYIKKADEACEVFVKKQIRDIVSKAISKTNPSKFTFSLADVVKGMLGPSSNEMTMMLYTFLTKSKKFSSFDDKKKLPKYGNYTKRALAMREGVEKWIAYALGKVETEDEESSQYLHSISLSGSGKTFENQTWGCSSITDLLDFLMRVQSAIDGDTTLRKHLDLQEETCNLLKQAMSYYGYERVELLPIVDSRISHSGAYEKSGWWLNEEDNFGMPWAFIKKHVKPIACDYEDVLPPYGGESEQEYDKLVLKHYPYQVNHFITALFYKGILLFLRLNLPIGLKDRSDMKIRSAVVEAIHKYNEKIVEVLLDLEEVGQWK